MDIGSHRINVFLHLFGEVAEVKAICETVAADYEPEDTALLLLKSLLTAGLCLLFRLLKIPASPMLVNTVAGPAIENMLPTPGAFDHEVHMRGGDITCVSCHDPHGSQKFSHLINFMTFTNGPGGTWTITSDCGGGPGTCGGGFTEPTFVDLGVQSGRCFLNCHGKGHDGSGDFTY